MSRAERRIIAQECVTFSLDGGPSSVAGGGARKLAESKCYAADSRFLILFHNGVEVLRLLGKIRQNGISVALNLRVRGNLIIRNFGSQCGKRNQERKVREADSDAKN